MTREEAINKVRQMSLPKETMEILQALAPELRESEDERIRKLLVWQVYRNIEDETNDLAQSVYDGIKGHDPDLEESIEDWKKCLAYLEKQKEEEGYEAIPVESTLEYKLGFKAGKESEKQEEQNKCPEFCSGHCVGCERNEQKDYRKLYEDIAKSEWFKKAYVGKSLGGDDEQKEQIPITESKRLANEVIEYLTRCGYSPVLKDDSKKEHFHIDIPRHEDDFWLSEEYKHCRRVLGEYYMEGDYGGDTYTLYIWRTKEEQKPKEVKDPFSNANFVRGYESGYADAKREQKPAQTDDEKEYIRTLKSLISDFIRDRKPEDVTFYQKIYDWLDERHIEQKPVEWTELTWKDIVELEGIINNVHYEFRNGIGQESFGKEVLEKFREYKGEYLDEIEQKPVEGKEYTSPDCGTSACCDDERFEIITQARRDIIEKTNIAENELSMELPLLDGILMRVWQVGWLNKKPAEWSEEDEKRIQRICAFLWKNRKGDTDTIYQIEKDADWLKSLPMRCSKSSDNWKPSEEQQMPDSTQLIAEWEREKAVLEQKDFRGDAERMAYNAFLDGFVKGIGYGCTK